jgi:hypothetical protein
MDFGRPKPGGGGEKVDEGALMSEVSGKPPD